jgi:hypothetical protein
VDEITGQVTGADPMDEKNHLAKVRVDGLERSFAGWDELAWEVPGCGRAHSSSISMTP